MRTAVVTLGAIFVWTIVWCALVVSVPQLIAALRLFIRNVRGCPRCHRRWTFPRSPLPRIKMGDRQFGGHLEHVSIVNGQGQARHSVVANCRHCGFQLASEKAPVFG